MSSKSMKRFGITINHKWDSTENEKDERERSCGSKERLTKGAAESRVRSLERKYKTPFDAYECRYCKPIDFLVCWHVGHSTRYFSLHEKYGPQ